jgi:hypothetical protein
MKKLLISAVLVSLLGCDYMGDYTFNVNNESSKTIQFRFTDSIYYSNNTENKQIATIIPGEVKTIRVINAPLNSPAHDCLHEHGMTYFRELIFDTYINSVKIEKQLWQPENWIYHKSSKYSADYTMTITEELIQ